MNDKARISAAIRMASALDQFRRAMATLPAEDFAGIGTSQEFRDAGLPNDVVSQEDLRAIVAAIGDAANSPDMRRINSIIATVGAVLKPLRGLLGV